MNDLLTIADLGAEGLREMLELADRTDLGRPLEGRGVALYFQKPSARTRNSMEMAVVQLGGHPVTIARDEIQPGVRESVPDVARTLACYHAVIAARVNDHAVLEEMAEATPTPVVNMLSDRHHPLQALADLMTIKQLLGRIERARVAWVGDGDNNVCRSLAQGCSLLGAELRIASPPGFELPDRLPNVVTMTAPEEAARGAQIVCTDVFVSMGQDSDGEARCRALAPFQVTAELMAASSDAWFMHCLPAHRGEEVAADVIDGPRSAVWRQAENRMHSARGALAWLMGVRP